MQKRAPIFVTLKKTKKKPFVSMGKTKDGKLIFTEISTYEGYGITFQMGYDDSDDIKDILKLKIEILN